MDPEYRNEHNRNSSFRIIGGGFILLVGITVLLRALHLLPSFHVAITDLFAVMLVVLGISIGVRSRFRNVGAFVLIFIGASQLIPVFEVVNGVYSNKLFWPVLLIGVGLTVILRKRRPHFRGFTTPPADFMAKNRYTPPNDLPVVSVSDTINIDVSFGGRKEIVTSKSFRGGSIKSTFAGAEINLAQADGQLQPMVLDIRVSFGSVELVVPSHWEIKNEISPTFGSVEDHRSIHTPAAAGNDARILVLRGTCNCGSVEVKSY